MFEKLELEDAAFSPGLTHLLYVGQFLWADPGTLSNFLAFSFFEMEYESCHQQQHHRHILCHLVQTRGQGRTLDELTKAVKLEVKAPDTYKKLYLQLEIFAGACTIFFGKFSAGTQSIKVLLTIMRKNKIHFKTAVRQDFEFAAKFLFCYRQMIPILAVRLLYSNGSHDG